MPSAARVAPDDPAADPEHAPPPPPEVVGVETAPFGARLVDRPGRTLYVFSLDRPGRFACVEECADRWQPARSLGGKPQPGAGATAPQIGNVQRPDGSEQMTFNGYPLYFYAGDTGPGQSNGHGRSEFGGQWSAKPPATPAGAGQ
jgi:predicted lipoprotein with Yx(FWY)xxD motif